MVRLKELGAVVIEHISNDDIVNVAEIAAGKPISIDCVYAKPMHPNNYFAMPHGDFKIALYSRNYASDKMLLLHRVLADIVIGATQYIEPGQGISIKDGLRTTDAQSAMKLVVEKKHLGKTLPETLLAAPGMGGHPRGMAVDMMLVDKNGREADVGTGFDYMDISVCPHTGNIIAPPVPKSSRENPELTADQCHNQRILERAMMRAAFERGVLLEPLLEEHWDFRIPDDIASLKDVLKSVARIIGVDIRASDEEITPRDYAHFKSLWHTLFKGHEATLMKELGVSAPPEHQPLLANDYYPISDNELPESRKMMNALFVGTARRYVEAISGAGSPQNIRQ